MVIEYAGTVIRSVLTDKRETYYDGKVSNHNTHYYSQKSAPQHPKSLDSLPVEVFLSETSAVPVSLGGSD